MINLFLLVLFLQRIITNTMNNNTDMGNFDWKRRLHKKVQWVMG